jgi:glycosyltransferase involved in cell wall biosynthesis
MKPLLLSTYDIQGGAARAAYRLHQGLRTIGVNSQILTPNRTSDDPQVLGSRSKLDKTIAFLRPGIDGLPLARYRKRTGDRYSLAWLPENRVQQIDSLKPDIVNLHWVGSGFLRLESLKKIKQPIVWTMHDMWALTGGCHYTDGCDRYLNQCGVCPQLGSRSKGDLSHWNWKRRERIFNQLDLTIVAPSQWLTDCTKESPLLRDRQIETIPYGLDLTTYNPYDKAWVRSLLKLPQDRPLILFGASDATSDRRKGFHLLAEALQYLRGLDWDVLPEIVIFGASHGTLDCGFPVHYLGVLQDDLTLALAYSAADVFVAPSIQDNLPNTVLEAIACGTPAVAFAIGGMPDLIESGKTGYLAQPFDTADLAKGIRWVLTTDQPLGPQARQRAEQRFGLTRQADAYRDLWTSLLDRQQRHSRFRQYDRTI